MKQEEAKLIHALGTLRKLGYNITTIHDSFILEKGGVSVQLVSEDAVCNFAKQLTTY